MLQQIAAEDDGANLPFQTYIEAKQKCARRDLANDLYSAILFGCCAVRTRRAFDELPTRAGRTFFVEGLLHCGTGSGERAHVGRASSLAWALRCAGHAEG